MQMTFEQAVRECRRLGVAQFKCAEFEFILGPEPIAADSVDKPVEKVKSGKVGRDGLTAEGQFDLYMRVVDAEE